MLDLLPLDIVPIFEDLPLLQSPLNVRPFGTLPDGRTVEAWSLCGVGGLTLEALTYGGIVTKLLVPDSNGGKVDMVLGLSDLHSYAEGHPYFGAIVGRVAGRISGAKFDLNGHSFRLSSNEPPHHLHGGYSGFDKQVWSATPVVRPDGAPSIRLDYRSCDGEEGYPGNVAVSVTYTVTNDNVFLIDTCATTDQPTPFSLTHHSYFNLAGEGSGSIANHRLQVCADDFIGMNEDLSLSNRVESVAGTPNDLRVSTPLEGRLPQLAGGHGAMYRVRKPAVMGEPVRIAELVHPASGRVLTCSTTNTYLQLYTASAFDGSITGKTGRHYGKYGGICLECEGYPNAANRPDLDDIILRPDAPQHHSTAYAFSSIGRQDSNAPAASHIAWDKS